MPQDDVFMAKLKKCYFAADEVVRKKFHRSLPFSEVVFDRWERARMLGFGEGSSIYNSSLVFGEVHVGEEVWIGPFTILDGSGGAITVGRCCSVSTGVHVYTHDSVLHALSGKKKPFQYGPVSIGDCSFIGPQSIISAGVSIGVQCVVGANSFVKADVPDRTIVAGNPARPIGVVKVVGEEISLEYGLPREGE